MVARQVARHKQGFVEIWLGDGLDGRRAQRIALHWQVADIVFVEFDLELLFKRPRMETRDLSKNFAYLPGGDSVIDDEVETDLGQRKPKFFSRTVNCPESTGQIRAKVDDRNDFSVSHLTLLPARRTIAPRKHRGRAPLRGLPARVADRHAGPHILLDAVLRERIAQPILGKCLHSGD